MALPAMRQGKQAAVNVKQYLANIGAKGGKAKSRAKLAAARANGKLGGRPKKTKRAARRHNGTNVPPGR